MRIRLVFHLWNKGGYVPFHHQFMLSRLIKDVNHRGNIEKFRNFREYNFSGLKGQTQVSRKGLHFFSNKVTLVLSCGNAEFLEYFLDNLFDHEEFEIGSLRLSPEMVEKEEPMVFSEKMKYVCISPLVVKQPLFNEPESRLFIDPDDDIFSDLLYESLMERMERVGNFSKKEIDSFFKFQIVPDKNYLGKIMTSNKKFARVYPVFDKDIKLEVRGYTFPFILYADTKVQEFIFNYGLGILCYKGFGMLDIANSNPVKRVVNRKARNAITT